VRDRIAEDLREDGPSASAGARPRLRVAAGLTETLRLAAPHKSGIARVLGLYLITSLVEAAGLVALNAGFSIVGVGVAGAIAPEWFLGPVAASPERGALILFGAFLALSVTAVVLDHLGWTIRLRLLSRYESDCMSRSLKTILDLDPRDGDLPSRRDMIVAVRGDCKSTRAVFNLLLLIFVSLAQIVFPLLFLFALDVPMGVFAVGTLVVGLAPLYVLGKRAGAMAQMRWDAGHAVGAQVSSLVSTLRSDGHLDERPWSMEALRSTVADQQSLWQGQYRLRSLGEKVPMVLSSIATFALLLLGVLRIRDGLLSWIDLMTMVFAARIVFSPFAGVGGRWVKAAEHFPRALRCLEFLRRLDEVPAKIDVARVEMPPVEEIVFSQVDLSRGAHGECAPPVDLRLRRGSVLTVVDSRLDQGNPLLRILTGEEYVERGDLKLNDASMNRIRYSCLRRLLVHLRIPSKLRGTLFDVVGRLEPGTTRSDLEEFVRRVTEEEYARWLPQGIDTVLGDDVKKRTGGTACLTLAQLYRVHRRQRGVLIVADWAAILADEARKAILLYLARYRDQLVTIWFDTAPRNPLENQVILVFENGLYRGVGDLEWFRRVHPDWKWEADRDWAKEHKIQQSPLEELHDDDLDEDDLLQERGDE